MDVCVCVCVWWYDSNSIMIVTAKGFHLPGVCVCSLAALCTGLLVKMQAVKKEEEES